MDERTMYRLATFAAVVGFAVTAHAAEPNRQLGAHEHGHGFLNVAVDGNMVTIEFQAPGSEVVVSQAAPGSDDRKRDAAAAVKTLEQPERLFSIADAPGCVVTSAKAHFTVIGDDKHGAGKSHGETKQSGKSHAGEKPHGHEKAHGHGKPHGDSGSHKGHRDYHGAYAFTCKSPGALRAIDLVYFETFPKAGKLTVQLIGPKGQTQVEVTAKSARIDLGAVN